MSHGQASRPVESNESKRVQIDGAAGQEELRVQDRDVLDVLSQVLAVMTEARDLLRQIVGG